MEKTKLEKAGEGFRGGGHICFKLLVDQSNLCTLCSTS